MIYLNSINKNPAKIENVNKEFSKQLNLESVKFPVYKKGYSKIEKQNISINVLGYEDKTPYCICTLKNFWEIS